MPNLPYTPRDVQPDNAEIQARPFLKRFNERQRSHVCNLFLAPVRSGVTTPQDVVMAVLQVLRAKLRGSRSSRSPAELEPIQHMIIVLLARPGEAVVLARDLIAYEQLPQAEKDRRKAARAATFRQQWMASQPASPPQITYLKTLGHTAPVGSMAEASALIDRLKGGLSRA